MYIITNSSQNQKYLMDKINLCFKLNSTILVQLINYDKITYIYRPEIVYDYYKPIYLSKKLKNIKEPKKPFDFPVYWTSKKPNNSFSQTRTMSTMTHNTLTHFPIQSTKLHASSNAESVHTPDHNKHLHHHYEKSFHELLEPAQTNHPYPSYRPGPIHYNCSCNYKN